MTSASNIYITTAQITESQSIAKRRFSYILKPVTVPDFRTYTPHMHITSTRIYPAQNHIISTKKFCTARVSAPSTPVRHI